jgi:hypothetical protein
MAPKGFGTSVAEMVVPPSSSAGTRHHSKWATICLHYSKWATICLHHSKWATICLHHSKWATICLHHSEWATICLRCPRSSPDGVVV